MPDDWLAELEKSILPHETELDGVAGKLGLEEDLDHRGARARPACR